MWQSYPGRDSSRFRNMVSPLSIDLPHNHKTNGRRLEREEQAVELDLAVSHFTTFLERVRSWMTNNEARLKKVYFVPDGSRFQLYVIAKSTIHDSDLTRSLCELLVELGDDGFDAFGSQIPDGTPEELAAYLDPASAFVLSWR
jgi:hypothetical protein